MSLLVFDIETVPDIKSGQKLYNLHGLSDADTAKAMFALRRQKTGHDFLPHHLQRVVAISVLLQKGNDIKIWSIGDETTEESELIKRFFTGIEKHIPTLVSWNGSGFDLPVLHYRALLHGIQAPCYWEVGEQEASFRWNNYINRFHYRHLDLMDILAAYQNKAFAPLDEIATMLDLPGKMGMHGGHVWEAYLAGEIQSIRNYCETDVLNTYCVYLRFEIMRGKIKQQDHVKIIQELQRTLHAENKMHLSDFLEKMPKM